MSDIKQILMSDARAKGICIDGYNEIHHISDKGELVNYYTANPDWCLERDFPSLAFLKEYFSDCEDKGVFIGKAFHGELLNDLQAYIFHNCKGTIKVGLNVDKAIIPMLYLANGCRLRIVGVGTKAQKQPSQIPVYSFGINDISAKSNRYVKFLRYSNDVI